MVLLVFLIALSPPAFAAKVKVSVPNPEHSCEALLDTKKMSKDEYERIAKFQRFVSGSWNTLGFVDSAERLAKAKKEFRANLAEFENAVGEIKSFKKARWKKLGEYILAKAWADFERESAVIAFMENWDPAPLLHAPLTLAELDFYKTKIKPGMRAEDLPSGIGDDFDKVMALPMEDRDFGDLTCNQRLRLIADASKLEKFSARYAKHGCQGNASPANCEKSYVIKSGMPKEEREGKRMYTFQWAWYNNGACAYTRGKLKVPSYDGPGLEDLLASAIGQQKCDEDGCGD